jgi:hypothetical protein
MIASEALAQKARRSNCFHVTDGIRTTYKDDAFEITWLNRIEIADVRIAYTFAKEKKVPRIAFDRRLGMGEKRL